MSANNQLLIRKKNDKYQVLHIDVDAAADYGVEQGTLENLGSFKRLAEAIGFANKFLETEVVEYGLTVVDV